MIKAINEIIGIIEICPHLDAETVLRNGCRQDNAVSVIQGLQLMECRQKKGLLAVAGEVADCQKGLLADFVLILLR